LRVRKFIGRIGILGLLAVAAPAQAFNTLVRDGGVPVMLLDERHDTRKSKLIALGELAFKSRQTLGASLLSCDTCHPDGRASRRFMFPGLSDKPGNIDVTNQNITHLEDGLFNPINIPSLIGARHTPPYGRDGRFDTIRNFTLFAIVVEFAGPDPSEIALDALVAYQESLEFPDNPLLSPAGRLRPAASEAAKRGEALFLKPFPGRSGLSCAACHVPGTYFRDGETHDVGTGREGKTGKLFETPTLLETGQSAPYFHDGRYDTLGEVVGYFDDHYGLGLDDGEQADLAAYLESVGTGETAVPEPGEEVHVETAGDLLAVTLGGDDYFLTDLVIEKVAAELLAYRQSGEAPSEAAVTEWIAALRRIEPPAARGDFGAARAALAGFRRLVTEKPGLRAASAP